MAKRPKMRLVVGILGVGGVCVGLLVWPGHVREQEKRNAALMNAVRKHDTETVRALLAQGADPNARERLNTPSLTLMQFCSQMLGRYHPDPEWGESALMLAARKEHLPMVQTLVEAGADVNFHDMNGFTPLIFAAYNVKGDCGPIVRLLVAHGADVHAQTRDGQTVWQLAELYPEIMEALPPTEK